MPSDTGLALLECTPLDRSDTNAVCLLYNRLYIIILLTSQNSQKNITIQMGSIHVHSFLQYRRQYYLKLISNQKHHVCEECWNTTGNVVNDNHVLCQLVFIFSPPINLVRRCLYVCILSQLISYHNGPSCPQTVILLSGSCQILYCIFSNYH